MSFKRTVRYVAFGGEEGGLLGSKAYADYCARKGEKIIAVLNADMVCYDEDAGARDDFVAGGGYNGRRMYAYLAAVGGLYGQKIIYEDLGHTVSDGRSFEDVGYPALRGRPPLRAGAAR
jgi:leucyl aminopeptidase